MKLSVHERMVAINLLPKEGSFTNLKLIRVAREGLSFTEEEHKALSPRIEGEAGNQRLVWDEKVPEKDIPLGEVATGMIRERLEKLDSDGKLPMEYLSLYEKFCEKGKNNEPE